MEFAFFGGSKMRFSERFSHHLDSVKSPGGLHELNEVFVVVNGGRHGGVVLVPLGSLDSAIVVSVTEVLEELQEHFILGHFAALDFRVHGAVVDSAEIGGGNLTTAIRVELEEGFVNHSLSLGVE